MNMEASVDYSIQGPDNERLEEGEGTAFLSDDSIMIQGEDSFYQFTFRDITAIDAHDYTVNLTIEPEIRVSLRKLGRRYEDFVRELHQRRNSILIEDMLIDETLKRSGIEADLEYTDPNQGKVVKDTCEVRLYETAIVFLPSTDLPIRLPFGLVTNVDSHNYTLKVETDRGGTASLSKLGRQFESFHRDLNEALSNHASETVRTSDSSPASELRSYNGVESYVGHSTCDFSGESPIDSPTRLTS